MDPWYKTVTPRREVREGRSFNPEEFTIRLTSSFRRTGVRKSIASSSGSPRCLRTALTEALRKWSLTGEVFDKTTKILPPTGIWFRLCRVGG